MVGESTSIAISVDPDDALRVAIKAAVDAGDLARASALLDVLRSSPKVETPKLRVVKGGGS